MKENSKDCFWITQKDSFLKDLTLSSTFPSSSSLALVWLLSFHGNTAASHLPSPPITTFGISTTPDSGRL